MKKGKNSMLSKAFYDTYLSLMDVELKGAMKQIEEKEISIENFNFYTAVSVMSSSRIEGETMEIDSYVKHKIQNIEYLPNLTEKPNDLFEAYQYARISALKKESFYEAHKIASRHLLPTQWRGVVRTGNMLIMDQRTNRVQYEAASSYVVKKEFDIFWEELESIIDAEMSLEEVFYFASLIHLVFVKIHPFNDGNGRTGRLLEKWFLASKLGERAWYIASEHYYYKNISDYYKNLELVGLYYDELRFEKCLPFLLMLPQSVINK